MTIYIPGRFSTLLVTAWVSLAALSSLHAQTEVVPLQQPTTQVPPLQVVPPPQVVPQQVVPVEPAPGVAPLQSTTQVVPVQPAPIEVLASGEHIAEIQLVVARGSVQAYFGRAARRERIGIGDTELSIKLPSTATVTKLASRDKDSDGSRRVTPDNPWSIRVRFSGPGRYVFNIVEWDDDPVVTSCLVRVDGRTIFSGRGSEDNINGWAQKSYGAGVAKSGSREVAFVLE